MAGRGSFKHIFTNFINSLKPRKSAAKLVGEDLFGNRYYEREREDRYMKRAERYFVPAVEEDFAAERPPEWESWLRCSRRDPPTPEEVAASVALMIQKKKNALELESKFPSGQKAIAEKNPDEYPTYGKTYEIHPGSSKGDPKGW